MSYDAEKQRSYRRRARCGVAIVKIPIDLHRVLENLIEVDRLGVAESLERGAVQRALSDLVHDWCGHVEAARRD